MWISGFTTVSTACLPWSEQDPLRAERFFAEALLSGQRAVPKKLESAGYKFKFATLDAALSDLFP